MLLSKIFSSLPYITTSILAILITICIILVLVGLFYKPKQYDFFSFNVRVFSFDYSEKKFQYFDKNNLSNIKHCSAKEFFYQFDYADHEKIKKWLMAIESNSDYSEYIQVNVRMKSSLSLIPSILDFKGKNERSHIIHFESYIVPHLSKTNLKSSLYSHRKKRFLLDNIEKCQEFLNKKIEDKPAMFFGFKLYRIGTTTEEDIINLRKINEKLRKMLLQFLNANIRMYQKSEFEEIIIDKTILTNLIAVNVGNTFASTIKQFLAFNTNDPKIKVAIGITTNLNCEGNMNKAIGQITSITKLISNDLYTDKAIMYDPFILNKNFIEQANINDAKMVIKNSTFRLYFDSTINILKKKQDFYYMKFAPHGTSIKTLKDILTLTEKIPEADLHLFDNILNRIDSRGIEETANIVFRLPYNHISAFLISVERHPNISKIRWTIGIREKELNDILNDNSNDLIVNQFEVLKAKNYSIALFLSNITTNIPTAILSLSDYFIFDETSGISTNSDDLQANLRSIKNNFSPFKGEICFLNLKTIDNIELFAHFCGSIFQSDELQQRSSTLEIIDNEKINSLINKTEDFVTQTTSSNVLVDKLEEINEQQNVFTEAEESAAENNESPNDVGIPQELNFPTIKQEEDLKIINKDEKLEYKLLDLFENEVSEKKENHTLEQNEIKAISTDEIHKI